MLNIFLFLQLFIILTYFQPERLVISKLNTLNGKDYSGNKRENSDINSILKLPMVPIKYHTYDVLEEVTVKLRTKRRMMFVN